MTPFRRRDGALVDDLSLMPQIVPHSVVGPNESIVSCEEAP